MTGNNNHQAVKGFLALVVFLGAVVFVFWYTARQKIEIQTAHVTLLAKKTERPVQFIDGARVKVIIGATTISAEVAESNAKKELGLGKRQSIGKGEGMLFAFGQACPFPCQFWNKDMLFPIDIVWIRDHAVVDVYEHLPTYAAKKDFIVSPTAKVNFVLEVSDGFVKENKIIIGDAVTYEPEKN